MQARTWPESLMVIRHGESSGNVARDHAEANGHERIDIAERDVDVPLSRLGQHQAEALGRWIGAEPAEHRPTVLWTSPYVRAQETGRIALGAADLALPVYVDERLREREFGVLDGLTRLGITTQYAEESARRQRIGKFYHRPPGGESWSDVLLRVRSVLDEIRWDFPDHRVMLVAHQVVVLLVRCAVESMTEQQILAVDAEAEVANCSVTTYQRSEGTMTLTRYNEVPTLMAQDVRVTSEPDVPGAPR